MQKFLLQGCAAIRKVKQIGKMKIIGGKQQYQVEYTDSNCFRTWISLDKTAPSVR